MIDRRALFAIFAGAAATPIIRILPVSAGPRSAAFYAGGHVMGFTPQEMNVVGDKVWAIAIVGQCGQEPFRAPRGKGEISEMVFDVDWATGETTERKG